MLLTLLLLCVVVWSIFLLYYISYRGFIVLLIWFLIGPLLPNFLSRDRANPFFQTTSEYEESREGIRLMKRHFRNNDNAGMNSDSVDLRQLLDPTRTLLMIFALVFLLEALVKRRTIGPLDHAEMWMLAFFTGLILSIFLQSERLHYSMRIALNAFMVPFLAYFVVRRLVRHETHMRKLIQVIGYLAAYLIVIGFVERLSHPALFYRISGPFRDEGVYYMVLVVAFLLTMSDAFSRRAYSRIQPALPSWLTWYVLCCAPIGIVLTMERGNWVGFLSSTFVLGFLGHRLVSESRRISVIGIICMLMPIVIVSVALLTPETYVEGRIGYSRSVQGRLLTWQVAIQEGLKNPLLGIGFNNIREVLVRNAVVWDGIRSYSSVHNSYIALLTEQGLVGLFLFLAILASIFRMGLRLYRRGLGLQERWRGAAVIALLAAYMMPSLFASKLHLPDTWNTVLIYSFWGGISGLYSHGYYARRYPIVVPSAPTSASTSAST
ncbi:MAG: hypothetical protein ETSY1_07375 [Candidatus Entotheonella factor]|uniref:O-antigen ligase-related domain-containing protein n=1 Tax=Entotheonella factor TaxID=1429438 RepID=W4LU94_ENTF1|nr:MAG: hypothetical protein ETSY1_07375 [Candidatus Entotheonella factor]